ncbi:tripartite motif-containing protein 2-like [Littorina saxatilis]|uniref:tripartite motif-containing protein 2-like n=1 Tax=Littorina saxatilis TaxID=31220 RepID=UPI0038B4DAAC
MAQQSRRSPPVSLPTQESSGDGKASTPLSPSLPVLKTFGSEFRLTCPVCLQDLKQPKQLKTCYHIFCADCVRPFIEKARNGKITCPTCNTLCPEEDVSKALNSDTYLHAFDGQVSVYAESGDVFCADPTHDAAVPAAYFCLECGKNYCESCHGNHGDNDAFRSHHSLRLFKTATTMTVGINRRELLAGTPGDDVDNGSMATELKCPICRNTDKCDHELWLKDLSQEEFRNNDECLIPEHADGNKLIAYCTNPDCEKPICRNCSMIEHKDHKTIDIGNAMKEKLHELKLLKKNLVFHQEIFDDAAKRADIAEDAFKHHILMTEREMIGRKGQVQTQVEEAFNVAFNLIEQTGQKQAELNKQGAEMHEEDAFLRDTIQLAENALGHPNPLAIVRIWKGLNFILEGMRGESEKKTSEAEVVTPQEVVEKRLVLPTPNCMNPDLRILRKVGIEGTVLCQAFVLKAEVELLLFYSILPLTETEALVSCKTEACTSSVVQYSNVMPQRYSVNLKDEGQYSIIAVPGNGIVATLYQAEGTCGCGANGKRQVLFWDQALDRSIKEHEAQGAGDQLKMFAETPLPPRGVAVTKDNHLVVCTAADPKRAGGEGGTSCILLMTMRGDILRRKILHPSSAGPDHSHYFPRYVTVNINGDICVTDEKDRSIIVFDRNLTYKLHIRNPYDKDKMNQQFCPMGICHDSFGRLIVADSNNHTVVRFELGKAQLSSDPQIILKEGWNGVRDLSFPTLVAMGPGPKLWVVCRTNIQVFDYMDKE